MVAIDIPDIVFDETIDGSEDVLMTRHILEGMWSVLFDPGGSLQYWSQRDERWALPWQIVLCLHGQICDDSLSLGSSTVRSECNRDTCRLSVNVHIIFEVRHLDVWQTELSARLLWNRTMYY